MPKNLYKVAVMYRREALIRYAYAFSAKQARAVLLKRLADEQGVHPSVVFGYFKEHPESVTVQIEMEVSENEDVNNQ